MTKDKFDDGDNYSDNEERSHRRMRMEKEDNHYSSLGDGMKDSDEDPNPPFMVSLCGLPYSSDENDIRDFLKGCELVGGKSGIEMTIGFNQKPNGIAFVELKTFDDLLLAKTKHKQHIGPRYIEVRRISEQDRRRMTERWRPKREPVNAVVCLKGLPFNCTTDDIREFFEGLEIENNGILIVLDERGRICGEGFVHFTSSRAVEVALRKHKERIKHRYIEVYRSDLREMYPRSALHQNQYPQMPPQSDPGAMFMSMMAGGGGGGGGGSGRPFAPPYESRHPREEEPSRFGPVRSTTTKARESERYHRNPYERRSPPRYQRASPPRYHDDPPPRRPRPREHMPHFRSKTGHSVHMRGLPYTVARDQICDFFTPILPVDIHIEEHANGMRSGNANVDFATDDDVREAMRKDRDRIDARYIELYNNSGRN